MKKAGSVTAAVLLVTACLVSAAFAEGYPPFSGFLGNPSAYDLLRPGPEGGIKLRWLKPGVDFGKYDKYMVDSVIFFLADKSDYKGIDPQEMKELADEFNRQIAAAMAGKWPIVAEPGPGVARVRIAITNVQPSNPGVSAITSIVPVGIGISLIKKGATGGWAGSGETCMEAMVLDSVSNEIVAMGVDQRQAEFDQRFSKWGSAVDAFRFWAVNAVNNIDALHGVKRPPAKQ